MKLPTLDKFLFKYELETGGLVLGWLSAVFSGIAVLVIGIVMILSIQSAVIVLTVVFVIYLIYLGVLCFASINLILGTKNGNHAQMKLYLILMAIGVIISFIQIFSAGVSGIASALIGSVVAAYFFICIYSLYEKFKGN